MKHVITSVHGDVVFYFNGYGTYVDKGNEDERHKAVSFSPVRSDAVEFETSTPKGFAEFFKVFSECHNASWMLVEEKPL